LSADPADDSRGLLDTNLVIHGGRISSGSLPAVAAISVVTIAELSAGVAAARDPVARAERLAVLQLAESAFEPLPFDIAAAHAYGRITAAVVAAGRSPRARVADQMIAAIALANRLVVYTTNASDYAGLDGLVEVVAVSRPAP